MKLLIYILQESFKMIVTPPFSFILIFIVIKLYSRNKKIELLQEEICGGRVSSRFELTLSQFIFGVIGGVLGSVILSVLNVTFSKESGIQILFLVSVMLMVIRRKYICFSYAGAIVGILSILINKINEVYSLGIDKSSIITIDVSNLILFVACMHVIEGILIILDGDRGAVPILKKDENNVTVGGYSFKRYWMMISCIIMMHADFSVIPFGIMCGFSTSTFTKSKRKKVISYGTFVGLYGAIMIAIGMVCRKYNTNKIISLIIMVVLHELMMKIQNKIEENEEYKFVSDENGLVVLEVSRDSKLKELGVDVQSKILRVNGEKINSEEDIQNILKKNSYRVKIEIVNSKNENIKFEYTHEKNSNLGILVVPYDLQNQNFSEVLKKAMN